MRKQTDCELLLYNILYLCKFVISVMLCFYIIKWIVTGIFVILNMVMYDIVVL